MVTYNKAPVCSCHKILITLLQSSFAMVSNLRDAVDQFLELDNVVAP